MDNELLVGKWHQRIIGLCTERLGRELTQEEKVFIVSRRSFVALEMIEETVRVLTGSALEKYLNAEK